MKKFLFNKSSIAIFFIAFLVLLIINIPAWMINVALEKNLGTRIKLINTSGSIWNGSGMLSAFSDSMKDYQPIVLLNWHISFDVDNIIILHAYTEQSSKIEINFANFEPNINIDNFYLPIEQLMSSFGFIENLSLYGVLKIDHTKLKLQNGKLRGKINVAVNHLSSGISKVNPLGHYKALIYFPETKYEVTSDKKNYLMIEGNGVIATDGLTLYGSSGDVNQEIKEKIKEFLVMFGKEENDKHILNIINPS